MYTLYIDSLHVIVFLVPRVVLTVTKPMMTGVEFFHLEHCFGSMSMHCDLLTLTLFSLRCKVGWLPMTDRSIQNITPMSRQTEAYRIQALCQEELISSPLAQHSPYKGKNETIHPHIPLIWMWRDFCKNKALV